MGNKTVKQSDSSGVRSTSLRPPRQRKHGQWSLSASMDESGEVLRKSSSSGCLHGHFTEDISTLRDRSASESQGGRRPSRDRKLRSGVSASAQALINSSFENAHEDTARRVYTRMTQRPEFAAFWKTLSRDDQAFMADGLKTYLTNVVACVNDASEIKRLSEEFGARHVQMRSSGFKPDFFATNADAVTTECVFLDHAVHPTSETFKAWTELITLMFSSVRDGYYVEVRRVRRQSYCFNSQVRHSSFELSSESDSDASLNFPSEVNEEQYAVRERIIPAQCLSVVTEERGEYQIRTDFGGFNGLPRYAVNNA